MELPIPNQDRFGLRRHKLGQLFQEAGLQLCSSGAGLPLCAPPDGQCPTAIRQRRDQQAPLAAQFQSVDQNTQPAALGGLPKKHSSHRTEPSARLNFLVVQKPSHSTRFAGLLGRSGQLVGHRRQMDVLRSVEPRQQAGQVSVPGFPQRRKRLADQGLNPILKTQAVAHRNGSVGQRHGHLQPSGSIPVTGSLIRLNAKLSGS
ncbi:hypothetical protein [Salinibacter ruber]|uniref:hypothetical protein n=1 Tax=Salinibacter ruber TaxID=146919 RepID=UPI002073A0BB|nr:hypothetical protein [Salinibacter ruber]